MDSSLEKISPRSFQNVLAILARNTPMRIPPRTASPGTLKRFKFRMPQKPAASAFQIPLVNRPLRHCPQLHTCCTPPPPRARRRSLPTFRERRYLSENYVERAKGRPDAYTRVSAFALSAWRLIVRDLTAEEALRRARWRRRRQDLVDKDAPFSDEDSFLGDSGFLMPIPVADDGVSFNDDEGMISASTVVDFEIPPWAYVVHVRAAKVVIGKRAVQRNRAKRRIRAAAAQVFPDHACRGMEYVLSANPESLTIAYPDLVEEVRGALKKAGLWREEMTLDKLTREQYCRKW